MKYTSLKLSKKLNDAGFKGESEMYWCLYQYYNDERILDSEWLLKTKIESKNWVSIVIPAYDILNDLRVKYAKELFGEVDHKAHSNLVFYYLKVQGKERAEKYIWEHCLFNK